MKEVKQHLGLRKRVSDTGHHGNVKPSTVNANEGDTELFVNAFLHRNKNDSGFIRCASLQTPHFFYSCSVVFLRHCNHSKMNLINKAWI